MHQLLKPMRSLRRVHRLNVAVPIHRVINHRAFSGSKEPKKEEKVAAGGSSDQNTDSSSQGRAGAFADRGPISFVSLGLMVVVGAGVVTYFNHEKEKKTKAVSGNVQSVGKPALGGPWVLVDHNGVPRTDASYLGKFTLLYFGFTYCPDICPSELVKVGKIMNALGELTKPISNSSSFSAALDRHSCGF